MPQFRSALLLSSLALDDFTGRWDLTVQTADGSHPSWLEVNKDGEGLSGRFVGRVGHARPVSDITVEGSTLRVTPPKQYEEMDTDLSFTGELANGSLSGTTNANAPASPQNGKAAPMRPRPTHPQKTIRMPSTMNGPR